jgi:hypothetical protein
MDVKFEVVDSDDLLTEPGRAVIFEYPDKTLGLMLCCPNCGKASASSTGNHKYNPATQTVTPSIIHDTKLGGCGWHGYLREGKFTSA